MNKIEIVNEYVKIFQKILGFYYDHSTDKAAAYAYTRKAKIFLDAQPLLAMEMTGAKLYQYKEYVLSGEIHKIKNHCEDEKTELNSLQYSEAKMADELINNINDTWELLDERDKKEFVEVVQELFDYYIKFLICAKND